jgi:hypothetical protein
MNTKQQDATADLADYTPAPDWYGSGAGARVFQTRSAFDWFVKTNRNELTECGALITRRGRAASLVSTKEFPLAVLRILRRRALDKDA